MEKNAMSKESFSLIEKSLNRCSAKNFKDSLRIQNLLQPKGKACHKDEIAYYLKYTIKELLDIYHMKTFSKKRLRTIMKTKLLNYENVAFNDRKNLWFQVSDAFCVQSYSPKDYYTLLRDKFNDIPARFDDLIELDINRTASMPLDYDDCELHKAKLKKCGNILRTYVKRNPDLGYCQGLNYIAWELIQRFEEEEAFWVLTVLLENHLPLNYYTTMRGVMMDQKIFGAMVGITMPEVLKKFKECNLDCSIFSIQWFVCLFCKTLNQRKEIMNIVFDNLFVLGSVALFKIGLALLRWLKHSIIQSRDFPQLLIVLEQGMTSLNDGLRFQELINDEYISAALLEMARDSIKNEENIKLKQKQNQFSLTSNKKKLKETQKLCNPEQNYCLTQLELNFSRDEFKVSEDFFIFRQDFRVWQKNDDYIFNETQKTLNIPNKTAIKVKSQTIFPKNFYNGDLIKQKDSLLLVRHIHLCETEVMKKIMSSSKIKKKKSEILKNLCVDLNIETKSMPSRTPTKQRDQTPSTETPEKTTEDNKKVKSEGFEILELNSGDLFSTKLKEFLEDEGSKIKNSLLFLRNQGVCQHFDQNVLEKYWPQIKQSESFCFNKSFSEFK